MKTGYPPKKIPERARFVGSHGSNPIMACAVPEPKEYQSSIVGDIGVVTPSIKLVDVSC